jgi:transglutaminase-like putative cysteine protease
MFIRLKHLTRYDYSQPVTFAPHALYLRPLDWAFFTAESPTTRLEFRSETMVETLDANPFDFFLAPSALTFPFAYDAMDRVALAPCLAPRADTPAPPVLRDWLTRHLPAPPAETVPFLIALNRAVQGALTYAPREEPGIQSAAETLARGGGSCRDYAAFLIELCRMLGLAARFVSGYLCEPAAAGSGLTALPAMHAWVEVYLPGAGWRGVDPTRGIFCDDAFVPVAHAAIAESVNPIQGTFYGAPNVTSQLTTMLSVEKL